MRTPRMLIERVLRRLSVGWRIGLIIVLLLAPLATLSAVSVAVLNQQEMAFRDSVEESLYMLLPLTTLEQLLDRALIDELEAQSHESVPDFASLTENIDHSFTTVEMAGSSPDLLLDRVTAAQHAWAQAKPSVQRLIEQVTRASVGDSSASAALSRKELQEAIRDVRDAREHLAAAVKARYERAATMRHRQLHWLLSGWIATLAAAALMIGVVLRSILRPIRELGGSARRFAAGDMSVRLQVRGRDELSALAEQFNAMAIYWEQTHREVLAEATEDVLTGLPNRRRILALLSAELEEHRDDQRPLAVFMIDLNDFKAINDGFGHAAGDDALVWVTQRMRESLRERDHLGRLGGDEFLAILPDTTQPQAQALAARMSAHVAAAAALEAARPTIGVGMAAAPAHGWQPGTLLSHADAELYASKQRAKAGRGD
ncbi:diguanylate cyclase domain-containing protein [Dyella sp. KRB-257]|uniref:GGDEF domain-containing protein n=1 Tax=Dyella sp. KRB-257 TaxID=3400915 RepID=UPI003BFE03A7